jgi:uncharacterized protein
MTRTQALDKQALIRIAERRRIAYLALFGSYARGQAKPGSDVDLYARFGRPVGLFEVLAVKHEMEDALGLPVDLIVEEAVIPYTFVRQGMIRDMIVLHDHTTQEHAVTQ